MTVEQQAARVAEETCRLLATSGVVYANDFSRAIARHFAGWAKPSLIYLASPYSHADTAIRDARFRTVCRVAARLMRDGHNIFSPIAHTHPIALAGSLPTDWAFWQQYDHAQLDAAAELWVVRMEGWDKSKGVAGEIDYMTRLGRPVLYVDPTPADLADAPDRVTQLEADRDAARAEAAKLRESLESRLVYRYAFSAAPTWKCESCNRSGPSVREILHATDCPLHRDALAGGEGKP